MQKFPDLKENQVALLCAEIRTGHVVDSKYNLAIDDSQEVYTVFKSLDEAIIEANLIIEERNNLECVILDQHQKSLKYIKIT